MNEQKIRLEEKIAVAVSAVSDLSSEQKAVVVGAALDALAPKSWLSSLTIRNGIIAAATGTLAVASQVYLLMTGGEINMEILVGGLIGVVTGINAVRGRMRATQPIAKP